jgi:hypothetical protein
MRREDSVLKMAHGRQKITTFGKVIYGRSDIGMGIVFRAVKPEDQKLLGKWIGEFAILHRAQGP